MDIVTAPQYRFKILSIIFILAIFFFLPKQTYAASFFPPGEDPYQNYQNGEAACYDGCGTTPNLNDCSDYGGLSKDNVCHQNPWTFKYAASCQFCSVGTGPGCSFNYEYQYNDCSTADRCYGSNSGASGYDSQGRVLPGICSASSYNGTDPNTACISGGWYKTCCSSGGDYPTTECSGGSCPSGQITSAGTTSCNIPPPPPGCQCTYDNDCVTSDGRAGKQTGNGRWVDQNDHSRGCEISNQCATNETACIATADFGSRCGNGICETSLGETCANCPDCSNNCYSDITPLPINQCVSMASWLKGMRLYIDPQTIEQGDTFTVTGTGERLCINDIKLNENLSNANNATCNPIPGRFAICDRNNPKDNRACWWQWQCSAVAPGNYNMTLSASNSSNPCEDCRAEDPGNYTITAAGRIKGFFYEDYNLSQTPDSDEPRITSDGACSGNVRSNFSVSIVGISAGTINMTIPPSSCYNGLPFFDSGLIPTGTYNITSNIPSQWRSTTISSFPSTNVTLETEKIFGVTPKGKIQGLKVPDNSFTRSQIPLLDNITNATSPTPSSYAFLNINMRPAGTHIVSVPAATGYQIGYTLCYNFTGCHSAPPVNGNSVTVFNDLITPDGFADLYWHYTPSISAWIQTIGGDVHSNVSIDMGGEP